VFAKSMHLLALGWFLSAGWVWVAGMQQHMLRHGEWPPGYGSRALIQGTLSAVAIEVVALAFVRWAGSAMNRVEERREWHHAFWWALFPNAMLLLTAYLMIQAGK
jgi:hypothetical protein